VRAGDMAPLQHEKRCAPAAKFVSNGIEELSLFILFQDEHSHDLSEAVLTPYTREKYKMRHAQRDPL